MFNITSASSLLISIPLLALSVAASIFFYRKTSITGFKKYSLISIKSLAIFLILVLFLEPAILSLIRNNNQTNIVLIDNSRSNLLPSKESSRKEQIVSILKSKPFGNSATYYTFSNEDISLLNLENVDSLKFDGSRTDLSSAIENLKAVSPELNFKSITLISDGEFNYGSNPLNTFKQLKTPILSIAIGDTVQRRDIVIDKIFFNDKVFTNVPSRIRADIKAYDLTGIQANLKLLRENNIVSTKSFQIKSNNFSETIEFDITESNPGLVKFTLSAESLNGEVTDKNNEETFYIKFIDSKVNLLFISDAPGYDNAFISSIVKRINNFTTTFKTLKGPNEFYEGPLDYKLFPELDAVFLLGFPSGSASQELTNNIFNQIKEKNIPVIFFASKLTDYKKLAALEDALPFSYSSSGNEILVTPQIISKDNMFKDISGISEVFKNINGIVQKAGSEVLMITKTSGEPIFINKNSNDFNFSAFLGYGMWKWRLNPTNNSEKTAEKFISESINLTLKKDKKTKLKVYTETSVLDYTDNIKIYAEVYDENYNVTRNAKVTAKVFDSKNLLLKEAVLTPKDNIFSINLGKLPEGDFKIEAIAEVNNTFYARTDNRFTVLGIPLEYKITKSNFEKMRELSGNTGGRFFDAVEGTDKIKETYNEILKINTDNGASISYRRFNLWDNKYILGLIILLLTIEWVIRKRNNIP